MRWFSSKEVPNTPKFRTVALPVAILPTPIELPLQSFPSSVDSGDMPFHFGSRSRMESSTTQSSATAPSSAHHTRQRTNSYKPLKGILKPSPPPEEPVKIPLFAPRPRKLSRASPVEVMEDAVGTRTPRPPSRMATPSQQNPASMQPSGWPHHHGPIPPQHASVQPNHHVFPTKPRHSSTHASHTPAYPPGVPLPPNTQYVYNVHAVQQTYAFPPKPHPERPSTALGTTQVFAPKPSKHDRSRHHSRKEGDSKKGKGKEREKEREKEKESSSRHREHREHSSRNHDRHGSRDDDGRRSRDRRGGAQTDTEDVLPSPPPPVLHELLQRRELHFRTPSGIDKKKLAVRFDISQNPMDKDHRVQLWDASRGRYVDITLADWRKPVSPHTVVQGMFLHMPHTYAHEDEKYLFKRDGLWLNDVFCAIYDMYDQVLNDEDLVKYASIIRTATFRYWFNERCKNLKDPDQARRLGYKHIDLLQGNVFFGDVKHLAFDRWVVRVVRDPTNELRCGDAYDQ